ncbi:hypothetical protein H6F32_12170 [Anabaena sp. FACHB-1237]|uniref:hypothetical protein n=1 Tax=Anabaena sp. FACHB-1237 TaxID=2692769 RepID=UPI0016819693|nr:hypothetical protein [Anabaena sp. FACHB-1237]MBD2138330.1 hypothetical protein [Anabaena sp. FACHB-1237]
MMKNPILLCTFLALSSGFFGGLITAQVMVTLASQKCQKSPNTIWGFTQICHTWIAPAAILQGSTAGIWTGTVLGAFVGGLMVRKPM